MNEQWIQKRYPHMRSTEADLWTAFLQTTDLDFTNVIYDLHLGEGMPPEPDEPESTTKLKLAVTRKRMDALGETAGAIWIFELKNRLGLSALGQLLAYFDLYNQEYDPVKPVYLGAIAYSLTPDTRPTYDLYAISIFILPATPPPLDHLSTL